MQRSAAKLVPSHGPTDLLASKPTQAKQEDWDELQSLLKRIFPAKEEPEDDAMGTPGPVGPTAQPQQPGGHGTSGSAGSAQDGPATQAQQPGGGNGTGAKPHGPSAVDLEGVTLDDEAFERIAKI